MGSRCCWFSVGKHGKCSHMLTRWCATSPVTSRKGTARVRCPTEQYGELRKADRDRERGQIEEPGQTLPPTESNTTAPVAALRPWTPQQQSSASTPPHFAPAYAAPNAPKVAQSSPISAAGLPPSSSAAAGESPSLGRKMPSSLSIPCRCAMLRLVTHEQAPTERNPWES